MSRFETMAESAWRPNLFDQFGRTVSYTVHGSGAASVTAAWVLDQGDEQIGDDGTGTARSGELYVSDDDVADPGPRDTVTVDGETWNLETVLGKEAGTWRLRFVRRDRTEIGSDRYRMNR